MKNSPIKQDAQLIRGAGIAHKSPRVMVGEAWAGGAGNNQYTQAIKLRDRLAKRREDEKELKAYVGAMKSIDVSKIEESMRPEVSEFLINSRNEYSRAADCASRGSAGDNDYMECVSTMNRINSSIVNLNENLSYFKTYRDGYLEDFEKNRISNQPGSNTDFLNSLFKNSVFDIEIGEDGSVDLMNDGELINVMDIDKNPKFNYHLKNAEGVNLLLGLNNQAVGLNRKFLKSDKIAYGLQLDNYLEPLDRPDLLSLVYDDDIQSGKSLFNVNMGTNIVNQEGIEIPFTELVNNPEYENELRAWLKKKYMSVFEGSASEAYTAGQDSWKKDYKEALSENKLILNKDISKWPKDLQDQIRILLLEMQNDALNPPGVGETE